MNIPLAAAAILLTISVSCAEAQSEDRPLSSFLYGRNGLRLQSVSLSTGYFFGGLQDSFTGFQDSRAMGSGGLVSGTASMAWSRYSGRSNVAFNYSPSYVSYWSGSGMSVANHAMSFSAGRNLSQKWSISSGLAGSYSSMDQILFAPNAFQTAASLPTTFEDLANALLRNAISSDQLASLLTGSPLLESPSRMLFGNKILNTSANLSLSYASSSRTTLSISAGGSRTQPIGPDQPGVVATGRLLTNATTAHAAVTMSHSRSPRTTLGVTASSARTLSTIQDAYNNSFNAFIGRKMGMRWFVQATAGSGFIQPVRQTFMLPSGPQYNAGGSMTYKTYAHTFLLSSQRTFGDGIGIGAGSTISTSGAWNWMKPRRTWGLFANVSEQRFLGRQPGNIRSWQASAGLNKALSSQFTMAVDYSYLQFNGQTDAVGGITRSSVRMSISWTPQPMMADRQ